MNLSDISTIRIEVGIDAPNVNSFLEMRGTLCHPIASDKKHLEDTEEMIAADVMKTPLECGDYALVYNGHAILGAKSGDKTFISGEGLRTPARADAVNAYLCPRGHSLDRMTWIYNDGTTSSYVGNDGLLIVGQSMSPDNFQSNPVDETLVKKIRFYSEYVMEMLDVYENELNAAVVDAEQNGYLLYDSENDRGYSVEDMMPQLGIDAFMIRSAMILAGLDVNDKIEGKAIWAVKQNIVNLLYALKGLPTSFKK